SRDWSSDVCSSDLFLISIRKAYEISWLYFLNVMLWLATKAEPLIWQKLWKSLRLLYFRLGLKKSLGATRPIRTMWLSTSKIFIRKSITENHLRSLKNILWNSIKSYSLTFLKISCESF